MLRSTVLPRRVTQLFADNKKSYEALVKPRQSAPELSHLHLKLRIQKDRLIAWGIQWSDRSTVAHSGAGDIDQSLDKAGISDLVESIMCSIRELLDEAESLQPTNGVAESSEDWSGNNIRRLQEILNDLTTSIDTLCDLSRSKVEGPETTISGLGNSHERDSVTRKAVPSASRQFQPRSTPRHEENPPLPPRRDDLTDLAYIDSSFIRQGTSQNRSNTSPPSYESVATGSENRLVACFSPPSSREGAPRALMEQKETPILLDYGQTVSRGARGAAYPDRSRFEELLLALLKFPTSRNTVYTGILKLTGWTSDTTKSRCAFVYEIPPLEGETVTAPRTLQPRSLLSFLQNSSDADSNNIPSLENRMKLAHNVALGILHLHEINITHRNLNSNNLLFFLHRHALASQHRIWKTSIIRKPYLTGFHQSGLIVSGMGSNISFTGLYHHPMLGNEQASPYELAHDYYSLGLILLEIGLWMPVGKFWKSRYTLWDFKTRLQDIYLKKLSSKCGDAYMNAVLSCITAADNLHQRAQHDAALDIQAQLSRYRETVIVPLERCCRMDNDVEPLMTSHAPERPVPTEGANQDAKEQEVETISEATSTANRSSMTTVVPENVSKEVIKLVREQPKIRVWSHELPALYSTYWTTTMLPKLERILRKALSRMESYTIDLFMAGKDPDTARPTVYMECTSTSKCQRILRHLNKELRLFEIKVVSGQVVRSKGSKFAKKKRKHTKGKAGKKQGADHYEHDPSTEDLNPHYHEQPICGASIGAYLNGSHLPPVTFGGAILVGGQPFGMSVHHMLEDEEGIEEGLEDRIDLQRSMAPRGPSKPAATDMLDLNERFGQLYPYEVSEPPEAEDTSSIGYPCSSSPSEEFSSSPMTRAVYPFEISDDDFELDNGPNEDDLETDFWLSPDFDASVVESDDEETYEMGDTDGITPGQGSLLSITQPALDDVHDGFFPSLDDADSEHLLSHSLGYVHASSGLRRSKGSDSVIHEIDWALIKIHPERLPVCLREASETKTPPSESAKPPASDTSNTNSTSILPSASLAARSVHSHTRSSGFFARGTILPSMRLVRMPGRISPSHSWQVRGSFGGGGDSGAWVFDDATGAVCGHVLAYSDKSGVAYIAPMDVMVEDMQKVLGHEIGLPCILPLPKGASITLSTSHTNEEQAAAAAAETIAVVKAAATKQEKGKSKLPLPATPERTSSSEQSRSITLKSDRKRSTASPAVPTSPPLVTDISIKPVDGATTAASQKSAKKVIDSMSAARGGGVTTRV